MKFLQKPEGVEDFLINKSKKKREMENKIVDLFELWGYKEVKVPMIEYARTYYESQKDHRMFQFSDEMGYTMSLRPDFTPSIARLASTYFNSEKYFPIRLCYAGPVFRITKPKKGERKESFQAGVESIGERGPSSDGEIVALACEGLKAMGLDDFIISLGHVGFMDTLLQELGLKEIDQDKVKEVLNRRNLVEYEVIVEDLSLDKDSKMILEELPEFQGERDKLQELIDRFPGRKFSQSLQELDEIFEIVEEYGLRDKINFDLSLLRRPGYYTGFIMEGYSSKTGFPLCGGGRYDELMSFYGVEAPATGFAFFLDKLLDVLEYEKEEYSMASIFLSYDKDLKNKAIEYAKEKRNENRSLLMDLNPVSYEKAREKAMDLNVREIHYMSKDKIIKEKLDFENLDKEGGRGHEK